MPLLSQLQLPLCPCAPHHVCHPTSRAGPPCASSAKTGLRLQAAWATCFVPKGTQPRLADHSQIQPRSLLGRTTCAADVMLEQLQLSFLGMPVGCGKASGSRAGLSLVWFGVTVLTQRGDHGSQSSPGSRLEVNSLLLSVRSRYSGRSILSQREPW